MSQQYQHFIVSERNFIQSRLNVGSSRTEIALALGRSRSSVSRESAATPLHLLLLAQVMTQPAHPKPLWHAAAVDTCAACRGDALARDRLRADVWAGPRNRYPAGSSICKTLRPWPMRRYTRRSRIETALQQTSEGNFEFRDDTARQQSSASEPTIY
jgi:hypothetical protein